MGASFGLPNEEEYFDLMPSAYFKNIARGAINYALGGVVAGIYRPEIVNSKWAGSNQVCTSVHSMNLILKSYDDVLRRIDVRWWSA